MDTNIISEVTRLEPNVSVTQKLSEHQREVGTATVVIHELLYGCLRLAESKKSQFFLAYISQIPLKMPILNYDLTSAQWHAKERARLSKIGKTPAFADGQIASRAYCNNLVLVTNNVSNFQGFDGLKVENWFVSQSAI